MATAMHTTRSGLAIAAPEVADRFIREPADILEVVLQSHRPAPDFVAIPTSAFAPFFFDLRSGFAGEILQKIANYRAHVAIVGDVSEHEARSEAFAALVREMNRGRDVWFVPDMATLLEK